MLGAFFWGLVATSSLVLGGLIGSTVTIGKRTLGVIMAFGAGTLIAAISYELVFEAVKLAPLSGAAAFGFLAGAFVFLMAEILIGKIGAGDRKAIEPSGQSKLVVPMVLAIVLDGLPESMVIGLGILETGTINITMLVAVFLSGLPEATAGTAGMKAGGWSLAKILMLWLVIALVCTGSTMAGYAFFGAASAYVLAWVHAFAGGAILMMLANTMIPEAYEHGGRLAGVFTVLGFAVSVSIKLLERV